MPLVLSNEEIVKLLPVRAAIDVLEPCYEDLARGEAISSPRQDLLVPLAEQGKCVYEFKDMSSVYPRKKIAAWRVNSDFLTWPTRAGTVRREKQPRAPGSRFVGLVLLFSMETGELAAIFPDGEMQRIRVAAANAIGARHLAREDASTLALLGSGFQAETLLQAICAVRAIREVRVFSPNAKHCRAFANTWNGKLDIPVLAAKTQQEAVRGATIVVAGTNSAEPVLDSRLVEPGMFLTSIRPFEFDRATLDQCDVLVVHSRESAPRSYITGGDLAIVPELAGGGALARGGVVDWGGLPDIGELLIGKVQGRTSPDQVACFVNNIGLSIQFAACGAYVLEQAREQGLGRELPGEWFTEEVHP